MNPIYLAYLRTHNLKTEPDLYKFIIWAHEKARAYRKAFNLPVIVDHKHYSNWIYDTATESKKAA
jgi:hypothetical protein